MGLVTSLGASATALMLAASLPSIFGSAAHEHTLVIGLGTLCAVAAVCTGAATVAMMSSDPWYESLVERFERGVAARRKVAASHHKVGRHVKVKVGAGACLRHRGAL
jgi:hypothetical protein